jgi:hypothetical protein
MEFGILKRGTSSSAVHDICDQAFCGEPDFHRFLCIEQKRSERSKKPFILMLLDVTGFIDHPQKGQILLTVKRVLCERIRETDTRGWYRADSLVGIIFTDNQVLNEAVKKGLSKKIHGQLERFLEPDDLKIIMDLPARIPRGDRRGKKRKRSQQRFRYGIILSEAFPQESRFHQAMLDLLGAGVPWRYSHHSLSR